MRIKNKIRTLRSSKGYTLVELLAVIIVMTTVGTIIAGILASTLRGGNKSNSLNEIRQSGNFTISQMSKMIMYAKGFGGIDTGGVLSTNCTNPSTVNPTPGVTAAHSSLQIINFDDGVTTFACRNDGNGKANIGSQSGNLTPLYLIDSTNVAVTNCKFTCYQSNLTEPPQISISFTLTKLNANNFAENNVSVPFQTSVTMRNLNQ